MKVFVLEDDPNRIVQIHEWLAGCNIDHAISCAEVDSFKPPYDLILLDHDLGGRQFTEHEDDGFTFIKLIKDKINPEAVVVFHSFNPDGAKRMRSVLGRGFITPFGMQWFKDVLDTVRRFHVDPNKNASV